MTTLKESMFYFYFQGQANKKKMFGSSQRKPGHRLHQSPAPLRMLHVVPGHYPFPRLYIKRFKVLHPHSPLCNSLQMSNNGKCDLVRKTHVYSCVLSCLQQLAWCLPPRTRENLHNHAFVYAI